jgi:twinkle protein
MELNGFTIEDYNVHKIKEGATSSICPKCSETRKKKTDKCMSVFWNTGLGQCAHCGETTQLHTYRKKDVVKVYVKPQVKAKPSPYSDPFLKYMLDVRGLSENTLKRLRITEQKEWMPQVQGERNCICFNYYLNNELINIKYRDGQKNFKLYKGAEKIFYNIDQIRTETKCIITEGEFDTASYCEAGINYVVSVPNGFSKDGNVNLDYLDDYYDYFDNKEKIYLAVDNDDAGLNGQRELIRRLGAERCYIVDFKEFKDANDYLIKYGVAKLRQTLTDAKPVPLDHIETLRDFEDELDDFFINGCPKGYETGIRDLDQMYSIEDGQYCVVTGTPQCFTKNQKIVTDQGSKEISKLEKGDLVLSYNEDLKTNEYKKVVNAMVNEKTKSKILRLKMKDGSIIEVTDKHRFFTGTSYRKISELLLSCDKFKNLDI